MKTRPHCYLYFAGNAGSNLKCNELQEKYDELCEDDDIREAFRVFDMVWDIICQNSLRDFRLALYICALQDGNGFITRTELTHALENIGLNMSKEEVEVKVENIYIINLKYGDVDTLWDINPIMWFFEREKILIIRIWLMP